MERQALFRDLTATLRSLVGLLEPQQREELGSEAIALCDYLEDPVFRIAVFAPFNYGKSTLINALLGEKTVPIDLIPTTGAAIHLRYGEQAKTRISLTDGSVIADSGTEILKSYAVLDERRQMREDVAEVEVFCPHPFLQTGIELLDLPGTDDREAQEELVRDRLLTCDLVIQVLDGRKLMTLGEREHLRDWLLDRGIETVVFVVNFLNLLEPEQRENVFRRLRFVAESFRAKLPLGVSNLYRVDALPALRARLKGDSQGAQTSGLLEFEAALQQIAAQLQETQTFRLPRIIQIAERLKQASEARAEDLTGYILKATEKASNQLAILEKAERLIQQGFHSSINEFKSWLRLSHLLNCYQTEIAVVLQQGKFNAWKQETLIPEIEKRSKAIGEWVDRAVKMFGGTPPDKLTIPIGEMPQVELPPSPEAENSGTAAVEAATELGYQLGGTVGAAFVGGASYILHKVAGQLETPSEGNLAAYRGQVAFAYAEAAKNYLDRLNRQAMETLEAYRQAAEPLIHYPKPQENSLEAERYQQQLLYRLLSDLTEQLEVAKKLEAAEFPRS